MLAVFARMASAKYLLDVEPKVLSSKQHAILVTRRIVKMRGLASGLTDAAYLVLVGPLPYCLLGLMSLAEPLKTVGTLARNVTI